jgi:hypothetical protein
MDKETKMNDVISKENAPNTLQKLLDFYDIVLDVDDNQAPDSVGLSIKNGLLRAIRAGRLEVQTTEKGVVLVQHLKQSHEKQSVTYNTMSGRHKMAMSPYGAEAHYDRMYALLGAMCGEDISFVANMKGVDNQCTDYLGMLFLRI